MRRLSYLIDGKADEHFERAFHLFGSDDPGGDSGGGAGEDIVTMGLGAPAQGGNVSGREELAMNNLIDEMDMEDRMAGIYGMDDRAGDRMLVNRNIENPMTTGFGPSAANPDVPANFFVGTPNLPPSVITGQRGERFDTQTGNIIAPLGDPYDEMPPSPAELFRAQESQRAMGLDQRQAGYDAYQAMLSDAVRAGQRNINMATPGLLGDISKFANQKFVDAMNTRIGPRGSEAYDLFLSDQNLFSPVYNQRGRLTGYRDQFGQLTGTDPINNLVTEDSDERAEEKPAVVMAEAPRCPDGYVFDEGLQACRLKTDGDADSSTASAAPNTGDVYYRETALDAAPANLPTDFDFDAANRRFTESYGYRPLFYQNPMDTTGFTKLV